MPNITDLSCNRNWKQAVAFYLIWLAVTFIACFMISFMAALVLQNFNPDVEVAKKIARAIGEVIAFIGSTAMAIMIIMAKNIKGPKVIAYVLGTMFLALLGGLGGLIIPAHLTTKRKGA